MVITTKILDRMPIEGVSMQKHTFVYNYRGKHRSDLKECQKAVAATDVMDKNSEYFRNEKKVS